MIFQKFQEFVSKYGPATPACMLGHRDTVAVKNWIQRQTIPDRHALQVEDMLTEIDNHPVKIIKGLKKQ